MTTIRPQKDSSKDTPVARKHREEQVVCFICRRLVPITDTLELDHTSGRFKVRVCHKHLQV